MRGTRAAVAAALVALAAPAAALAADTAPAPIDPQNWSWQDELTWNDYKPLPGPDYADPSIAPTVKKWKVALVVTDFQDKTFTISQPPGGTVFGTPTAEAQQHPARPGARVLSRPPQHAVGRQPLPDHEPVLDGGLLRPLRRPTRRVRAVQAPLPLVPVLHDGRSAGGHRPAHCPDAASFPCNKNFRTDARAAWQADVGAAKIAEYDNIFYVAAGAGRVRLLAGVRRDEVGDAGGGPGRVRPQAVRDPAQTNWALTRYVPWTSWVSAASIWPSAQSNNSIEAESSGMSTYAHELSHNLSIPDNYGNPYATVQQRGFTGMWDMMSRGTFNGPGGPHTRFLIPPTQGSALGSQHNIRNKRFLNFVGDSDLMRLNRNGLALVWHRGRRCHRA